LESRLLIGSGTRALTILRLGASFRNYAEPELENLRPTASAARAAPTRPVVGRAAVVNKSSENHDSLQMYLAGGVVILAVVAILAYSLQGGENKRE
jgi:hypothetical protein